MGAEVLDSGRTVSKTLATLGAKVGFLPCVHTMVFHQIRASAETFATLGTLVGLVTCQRWGWLPSLRAPGVLVPSQVGQKAHHWNVKGFEASVRGWCQEEVEVGWG